MASWRFQPTRHRLVKRHYNRTLIQKSSQMKISSPSRVTLTSPTREDNILDLFFTNRPSLVNRSTIIPGISDHHAIYVDSHISMKRQKPVKRQIFMWGKANIQGLKEMCKQLSHSNISQYTSQSNIDDVWSFFKEGCQKIVENNVPSGTTSQRFSQPWINRDIRRITRLKRH